ncbi:putative integral membrane protein [Cystobacter fuscus DSM 2262]|uniref:Integral membrane protein n=1 Tax=Cystobacter fuscus (strain ATCC 25194 / DSM 2262 / NBRC 100088 / M29) TaxID=1242864 RepID=S9PF37_CYSF2|nr:glycosyltransferase family 39 protein [Cystobacter fuscus]EPX63005.1 putative integral membrane protein [Cystobacter fuscus DSM 2262]
MTRGRAATREERWLALALWVLAFAALWASEAAVGFTRDESFYFHAAEAYSRWFQQLLHAPSQALTDAAIVRAWDYNHEHPALMKTLFGLSHLLFHDTLGWLRSATAFRLPAFALAALVPALTFLLGSAVFSRAAGLFAALSFLLVPRQYFNAELACFDMPIAAMWLLVVYAFWRALEDRDWGVLCGVFFGLAVCTKHNALFLPFCLAPFALWRAWRTSEGHPAARLGMQRVLLLFAAVAGLYALLVLSLGPEGFQRKFFLLSPHTLLFVVLAVGSLGMLHFLNEEHPATALALLPLATMAVFGPVIFYLHWPYLWHAPVDRTAWYLVFHATHNHYAWFYLGTLMREPPFPWDYVVVKTALTVPTSLFVPMVTGLGVLAARGLFGLFARTREWVRPLSLAEVLVGVNALASILIISPPNVPHFGGVKHWLPSMPFLGLLAGVAVARGCEALTGWLRERWPRVPLAAVAAPVFTLLMLPALLALVRVFPYGTSYYSELAGGVPGAASLGMQRQFWSSNVTAVLPWINAHAPRDGRVFLHEVTGFAFQDYQREGLLRADLRPAGIGDSDVAAYQYHQEFREHEFALWQAYGTRTPATGLYLDETPQIIVYQRP